MTFMIATFGTHLIIPTIWDLFLKAGRLKRLGEDSKKAVEGKPLYVHGRRVLFYLTYMFYIADNQI